MVAELAAGAGHEMNNPLSVISGRVQLLMRAHAEDAATGAALEQILAKAHECSRIVSELMEFAQPRPAVPTNVSVSELLGEVERNWRGRLPAGIQLEISGPPVSATTRAPRGVSAAIIDSDGGSAALRTIPPRLTPAGPSVATPQVFVDRDQVRAVFDELLDNAVRAMTTPGPIRVVWRRLGSGELTAQGTDGPSDTRGFLEVAIHDSGAGMSASVLRRAFDPFFSHRDAGRRRGLGLAWALRVIEAQGGRLRLESRPQRGTSAYLLLPLTPSSAARSG